MLPRSVRCRGPPLLGAKVVGEEIEDLAHVRVLAQAFVRQEPILVCRGLAASFTSAAMLPFTLGP
jgi:hypothetical protein